MAVNFFIEESEDNWLFGDMVYRYIEMLYKISEEEAANHTNLHEFVWLIEQVRSSEILEIDNTE